MSAFLSLVLASALTASAGVSSPSYPIRETIEATADSSSSSSNDPLHPTYVVESDLHDVWKAASQKERPLVEKFNAEFADSLSQVYSANTGNPIGTLPVIDIPGGGVKTC